MAKKSKFGVKVGNKSKVVIEWKDKPENYSNEAKKHIIAIVSERYEIPKESVKVHFIPTKYNEKGEIIDVSTDVVNNIQDPKFQLQLFIDYINENGIEDVDMEFIKKIDSEINSKIDYEVYDKYKRYEIEWLEWDNFQSYGEGNKFSFSQLNGLTLVNGVPGNMSGKCLVPDTQIFTRFNIDEIVEKMGFLPEILYNPSEYPFNNRVERYLTLKDISDLYEKYGNLGIQVETQYGFKEITNAGITANNSEVYKITLENYLSISGSNGHLVKKWNNKFVKINELKIGDTIQTKIGNSNVKHIEKLKEKKDLYDIEVAEVNEYYSNGIVSHNSTFTTDLISFLLFGKSQKPYTLSQCFNKHSDSKFFRVCGGIMIDGLHYVIERNVTRSKKKDGDWGDAKQEVKYYEIINDEKTQLPDEIKNNQDEHSVKTSQIIKQAIGSEKDFNMIICATSDDLDSLINTGNAEKGRLLSKWIGLLPLEEKEKIGKEKHKEFDKNLKSKQYDIPSLEKQNIELLELIQQDENNIITANNRLNEVVKNIKDENTQKETLLLSKKKIDENVLKIDITTINKKKETLESEANKKKEELKKYQEEYEPIKDIVFIDEDYRNLLNTDKQLSIELNNIRNEINTLKETNNNLKLSEFCPTCKRKYEGLDNSLSISQNEEKINKLIKDGVSKKEKIDANKILISNMENNKILYDKKLKVENYISIIPVQIDNFRASYREQIQLIKDYNENKDAIEINNQIDISLTNVNAKIRAFELEKSEKTQKIENFKRNIIENNKKIEINKILIDEITKELVKIRNWKIYLEMVGKNGVSKMVLRKTLPIINSELCRILDDVCDFETEVYLNDKNEVMFNITRDGISSDLAGGSGFEKTAASLALRHVLGNISTMPRPNFITLDEILGKVAKEYYDNIHNLYAKIVGSYQFVLHITHIEDIKDWHKNVITINKNDKHMSSINVSTISDINNN